MILGQSLKHVPVYVLRDEATIKEALHYGNYHDMTTTVVAGERRGASEEHAVPFQGRGFHHIEGNVRSEDFSLQGHEWRWACKERKAMPLFDQHGLEKQNGRVKEVAASLAKGAILALGKRESLTLTLTDMPEEIIDTIVGHLVADRVGCITGSTQPFARTLLLLGDDGRMEYRMLILDVRPRMYHSQSETHANFLHMDNMSALPAIPIMNLRASMQNLMPTLLAHTREAPMGDRYLRGYSSARFYAGAEQHASGVRFFGLPEQERSRRPRSHGRRSAFSLRRARTISSCASTSSRLRSTTWSAPHRPRSSARLGSLSRASSRSRTLAAHRRLAMAMSMWTRAMWTRATTPTPITPTTTRAAATAMRRLGGSML